MDDSEQSRRVVRSIFEEIPSRFFDDLSFHKYRPKRVDKSSSVDGEQLAQELVAEVRGLVDGLIVTVNGCKLVDWSLAGTDVCWSPAALRIVADYLDELNSDWYRKVDEYFDRQVVVSL